MSTSSEQLLTPADLPPSPPPSKRRGIPGLRSMVLSMLVLTIMLFAFYAIVARPERMDRLPVDSVAAVQDARAVSGRPFSALETLPAGWTSNNARYAPDADGLRTWSVGYVHGGGDGIYDGVRQVAGATRGWYSGTLQGFTADGYTQLDGTRWERWVNRDSGERRLVKRGTGDALTTVLVSSLSYDDAAAFAARLTPKP